jgi:ubiquinone/menaquinone biosynthesis C-methylase UbiE
MNPAHFFRNWYRPLLASLLSGLLLAFTVSVPAAEQNVAPGINRHYEHADYDDWVSRFESTGREVYDQRHSIVDALDLKSGMRIADVGAGTGLFTILFAKAVGTAGKVFAVDISDNFVHNIIRRADKQGLKNIEGIVNSQKDTKLKPGSVELVFISDTYHHFEYPQAMLHSMHQALTPGGRLVIIDFRKQQGVSSGWVMSHVRADKQSVIREVEAAGFRYEYDSGKLKTNYFLFFRKP